MNITETSSHQYQQITPLLETYADYPVINAVIEGHAPGRVFTDHATDPQSAFVLTNAGFSYLLGSPKNRAFNQALKGLLDNEIFPEIKQSDDPTLIFYPLSDGWEAPLKEMLTGREVYDIFRKQFTFNQEKFSQLAGGRSQIPAGFSLHPIDQDLLNKFGADMFPWESPQFFLEKGFGFWLLTGDEIACECSSVFVGGGSVEINIHTDEKYQRQGLASIAATAFITECLKRGIRPNWECWWDNEPSVSLAQKLGFEPVKDHPVFLVELAKNIH
jgi:RimJ/RimL family protein N-acetyltransferase